MIKISIKIMIYYFLFIYKYLYRELIMMVFVSGIGNLLGINNHPSL
jgi:hypothetical protein